MHRYFLLLCLSLSTLAATPDPTLVTQAANQRVLVERLARNAAWRWLMPTQAEAAASRQASQQFEHQLATLNQASRNDAALAENYQLLSQQWQDFQPLLKPITKPEQARQMLEASEEMAWIAQKGSQQLEAQYSKAQRPVRLAEDIAALSQRLAKIYLLRSAGLTLPFLAKDLASARNEFDTAMRELHTLPNQSPSLQAQLQLVSTQWLFFQQAIDELAKRNTDPQLQRNVYTTSERIYEVASELAQRYQHAGN